MTLADLLIVIAVWFATSLVIVFACLCVPLLIRELIASARTWLTPDYVIKAQRHNTERPRDPDSITLTEARRAEFDALVDLSEWRSQRRIH